MLNEINGAFIVDEDKQYILVTGRLTFNDLIESTEVLENFNRLGEAMYRVTNNDPAKPKTDGQVRAGALASHMQIDKKFGDALGLILKFGYRDLFEIEISVGPKTVMAPLKRESLREKENIIIQKYSRYTQKEFSILGVITKVGRTEPIAKSNEKSQRI